MINIILLYNLNSSKIEYNYLKYWFKLINMEDLNNKDKNEREEE
jgi:hypothetical protein